MSDVVDVIIKVALAEPSAIMTVYTVRREDLKDEMLYGFSMTDNPDGTVSVFSSRRNAVGPALYESILSAYKNVRRPHRLIVELPDNWR